MPWPEKAPTSKRASSRPSAGRALSGGQFPFAVFLVDARLAPPSFTFWNWWSNSDSLSFMASARCWRSISSFGMGMSDRCGFIPNLRPLRPPVLLTHGLSPLRAKKSLDRALGGLSGSDGGCCGSSVAWDGSCGARRNGAQVKRRPVVTGVNCPSFLVLLEAGHAVAAGQSGTGTLGHPGCGASQHEAVNREQALCRIAWAAQVATWSTTHVPIYRRCRPKAMGRTRVSGQSDTVQRAAGSRPCRPWRRRWLDEEALVASGAQCSPPTLLVTPCKVWTTHGMSRSCH